MLSDYFLIRPIKRTDLSTIEEWAIAEGWNPGRKDGECFYEVNGRGWFVGVLNGKIIGCISMMRYSDSFSFIGLHIISPYYRGKGYGLQLWNCVLKQTSGQQILGLDGTIAYQGIYQRAGFNIAYHHLRYQGIGGGSCPDDLIDVRTLPFEKVVDYDRQCFPTERGFFLHYWLKQPDSIALGLVDHETLVGYGMMRPAHVGWRIGPLFANTEEIATKIWQGFRSYASDAPIFIDIPDLNLKAIALVENHHCQPILGTARMYFQSVPALPVEQIFGVTTLELG